LFWEVVLSSPHRSWPVSSDDYEEAVEAHSGVVSHGAGMADAFRTDAMSTAHACRVLGTSAAPSRRWHQRYGLMLRSEASSLRELREQNLCFKQLLAKQCWRSRGA
jgi:hypothetical protein